MKTRKIRLALCAVAMLGAGAAFGSTYFHIPSTYADQTTASWDDADCWWSNTGYTTSVDYPSADAQLLDPGVTVCVTNDITQKWSKSPTSFNIRAKTCSVLHIKDGGVVKITTLLPGGNANTHGMCVIDAGGKFQGGMNVGRTGYGVVTNSGAFVHDGDLTIGTNTTGVGLFVHDGGTNSGSNPKRLTVGQEGIGDLVVKSGEFRWKYSSGASSCD